ncbi:MAG: hypothetical protein AAF065_10030 [Verrucomicrobiota bacterium]
MSPLRQFTHEPLKVAPSRRMHRFFVICYWLVPTLVLLLIILGSSIFVIVNLRPESVQEEETDSSQTSFNTTFASSAIMGQGQLLETYVEAIGGRDVLMDLRSLRRDGTILGRDSEEEFDFQLIASLPDKLAFSLESSDGSRKRFLLNGAVAWQVVETEEGIRQIVLLEERPTQAMIKASRLYDPLLELALGGQGVILAINELKYNGVECLEITKMQADGSTLQCFLSKRTFYLIAVEETVDEGGEAIDYKTIYSDHRMVSGIVQPFRKKAYKNDILLDDRMIRSIRVNSGVMSSLFKVPEDLVP